jgi:hypothetical protein
VRTLAALAVVVPVALLGAVTAQPATADTWRGHDAKGDVRAFDFDISSDCEELTPRGPVPQDERRDITGLAVDHGLDTVVVTASLRDVVRRDRQTSYQFVVRTPDRTYEVQVYAGPGGQTGVDLASVRAVRDPDFPECSPILESHDRTCDTLVADLDPGADTLTATIPRSCLGDPRWVRVGVSAGGFDARGLGPNTTVIRIVGDVWGPRGVDLTELLLAPTGPRVHGG